MMPLENPALIISRVEITSKCFYDRPDDIPPCENCGHCGFFARIFFTDGSFEYFDIKITEMGNILNKIITRRITFEV